MAKTTAKILLYDLEVSRDIVEGYGNKWEFKVVKTIRHQELMCFAYKFLGDKTVKYVSRHDFAKYDDFVKALWDILNEADIAIAHNAARFDNKMANRFFIKAGLGPVSPYKTVDTLQVARGAFKFQSNGLNDLAEYLDLGSKVKMGYADLEEEFMNNPTPSVERLMKKYNVQDVVLLEKIYLKLRPFIKNHPNIGDILQEIGLCPKCGSPDLRTYGTAPRANGRVQTYICNTCGGRCSQATIKSSGRIVNA